MGIYHCSAQLMGFELYLHDNDKGITVDSGRLSIILGYLLVQGGAVCPFYLEGCR